MSKQPKLSEIIKIARQAGEFIRDGYGKHHAIKHKGIIDLVTETDKASEAFLLQRIQAEFPGHMIISEEKGEIAGDKNRCWYLDPLDGTINFAHNIPFFSVSIAYEEDNQIKLAVAYDPMRDECFSAELGLGAYLNNKIINVSTTEELIDSVLGTGFPYTMGSPISNNLNRFAHMALISQGIRRMGSAVLDLCYVAAGRFDGFWELGLSAWDIAAGSLIVREAGGKTGRLDQESYLLNPPCQIVAANPHIYQKLIKELRKVG